MTKKISAISPTILNLAWFLAKLFKVNFQASLLQNAILYSEKRSSSFSAVAADFTDLVWFVEEVSAAFFDAEEELLWVAQGIQIGKEEVELLHYLYAHITQIRNFGNTIPGSFAETS